MTYLTKLELDVFKSQYVLQACEFAAKYTCPAITVSPDLVHNAIIMRGMRNGKFKIIAAIDWPNGIQYASDKLRGLPVEATSADGFEILLTPGNSNNIVHEVKYLSTFFEKTFNKLFEVRYVLGVGDENRSQSVIDNMCIALTKIPLPAMIRTTHIAKIPRIKDHAAFNIELVKSIKKLCSAPLKIGCNVDVESYVESKADRFAIPVQSATNFLADFLNYKKPVTKSAEASSNQS